MLSTKDHLMVKPFLKAFETLTSFFDAFDSPYIAGNLKKDIRERERRTSLIEATIKTNSTECIYALVAREQTTLSYGVDVDWARHALC